MNTRRLRQIQKLILKYPQRFNINSWFSNDVLDYGTERYTVPKDLTAPTCGTTACIAGWAVSLHNGAKIAESRVQSEGAKILDLTRHQRERLFFVYNWPYLFRNNYAKHEPNLWVGRVGNPRYCAYWAAKRIDHFIKTKGAE